MDWRASFSNTILSRGLNYALKGKVKGLTANGDRVMARVLGTKVYLVQITGIRSGELRMSCSCPYAEDGQACKHMAAVLYAWEAQKEGRPVGAAAASETGKFSGRELFPNTEERKGLFFNPNQFTAGLTFTEEQIREARELVAGEQLRMGNLSLAYQNYGGNVMLTGDVEADCAAGSERTRVHAVFTKRKCTLLSCSVCDRKRSRYNWYRPEPGSGEEGVCAHRAALLLVLDDYLRKTRPGDETDVRGNHFLRNSRIRDAEERAEEKRPELRLQPRVIREYNGFQLGFRIGEGRMYVVKDLDELVASHEAGGVMEFGKNYSLSFAEQTFAEDALPWFRLIEERVGEVRRMNRMLREKHAYYMDSISAGGFLDLTGRTLDRFYELAQGQETAFQDKTDSAAPSVLRVGSAPLAITLEIRPKRSRNQVTGITVEGTVPELLAGESAQYLADGGTLSRVDPELLARLRPVFDSADYGHLEFTIGRNNLPNFYYRALPALEETGAVSVVETEPEKIRKILKPEAKFRFYLDAEEGVPLCRAEVAYDDAVWPVKKIYFEDLPLDERRDVNEEMDAVAEIRRHFPDYQEDGSFRYQGSDDQLIVDMQKAVTELLRYGEVHATDAFDRMKARKLPPVRVGVSIESNLLELEISSGELTQEELLEVLRSYRLKKRFHRLRDGRFLEIAEDETLQTIENLAQNLDIRDSELLSGSLERPAFRALYLNRMLEEHEELVSRRDRSFRQLVRGFENVRNTDAEIPESLAQVLRGYQRYGFRWIHVLREAGFGGILADDMGLGKTLQVIAVLLSEKEQGSKGPSLVVCPASLVFNWLEEIRRFAPALRAKTLTGTKEERQLILAEAPERWDVLITSYDLLKRDAPFYAHSEFLWQVLDEAQFIKNPKTAAAKSVKIIKAAHRLALTGTPIENRLSELWSIFDYLMPGFLYKYETFRRKFETPIVREGNAAVSEQLRKMAGPFILRRLKQDVLKDLPEKLEEVRYSAFEEEQQRLYDARVTYLKGLLEDFGSNRMTILAELTRLRQVCCDPSLLVEGYTGGSAKREACLDLIESALDGGHRVLVFSQFTSMLALLEDDLTEREIPYFLLTGATPKEERVRLMHAFNEGTTPVFLISLKAGGTGLNLTGADIVIHYDPWWNLAAQNQATDRAHRIGQTKVVSVYRLIAKHTIEEKILALQEEKKDLADAILAGEQSSLMSLSYEELCSLLDA